VEDKTRNNEARDLPMLEIFYLSERPHLAKAKHELSPARIDIVAWAYDEDDFTVAFIEAFLHMRHALALAGKVGRMCFSPDPSGPVGEQAEAAARRAAEAFAVVVGLAITQDDLQLAPLEEAEYLQEYQEYIQFMEEGLKKARGREEDEEA
jgi:hypothetical protein